MLLPSGQSADAASPFPPRPQATSEALADLRQECHGTLANILRSRGASPTETEDVLADLWADCVPAGDDRPSLLEKFSGRCSVQTWLATVATRRWIDLRRTQARRPEVGRSADDASGGEVFDRLPAPVSAEADNALVELLRQSLRAAFLACPPEALVVLRLVHLHGLTQREIVRMLGWSESKVSRVLADAMQHIELNTLRQIKQRDSWLELTWQDFVDLCATHQLGFL